MMGREYTCCECGRIEDSGKRGRLRQRCPDCSTLRAQRTAAKWASENRMQVRLLQRSWRKRNPDRVRANAKRWRDRNREKISEYNRKYQLAKRARARLLKDLEESPER